MPNTFDPTKDLKDAMKLAQSPAGQQLLRLLQSTDKHAMQEAMDQAAAGNYQQVQATLRSALENPQVQELIRQLGIQP